MISQGKYPQLVEVMKITDTAEGNGVYKLDVKIQFEGDQNPEECEYISRPNDPYGVNPQIRQWMSEHPEAPVHVYVPPTAEETRAALPRLTARQLRLGLVNNGFAPSLVTAALGALPSGPAKETALIEWEYATTFDRTHTLISTVGAALGLSEEQIDAFWTAALEL